MQRDTQHLISSKLRDKNLLSLQKSLREGQRLLASWQGGQMAISAVPGAGKSHSLAVAAALTIARHQLHSKKQLVIVTYTRSAAAAIKRKIRDRLKELLLPQDSFMVQTLHGLALHIASRHPDLSRLNLETATLINPSPSHRVMRTCVEQWLVNYPESYHELLEGKEFDGEETERLRRQSVLRTEVLPNLAHIIIREAKSSGLLPEDLWQLSHYSSDHYGILAIAAGLYEQYQQIMQSKDLIDYDDMILAALRVLEEPGIRKLWQRQFFAVFEDEAQDSSPLQEKLITVLASNPDDMTKAANLIRVGDPNQAINSTFTPADPLYFNWFCDLCEGSGNLATMNQAGRSSQIIIDGANFVLKWVNQNWAKKAAKVDNQTQKLDLAFRDQDIIPVPPNDPQSNANPVPVGQGLEIYTPEDIYVTVDLIKKRVIELFNANPDHNAAILVRENRQGRFLRHQLGDITQDCPQLRIFEVSETERYCQIPDEILKILQFIDRPHSPDNLKAALEILEQRQLIATQDLNALAITPEQFLYPSPLDPPQKHQIRDASRYCCNLLRARLELPHYQLIPFLGMTLQYTGSELATVQKLADRIIMQITGNSSLKTTILALQELINSEKFEAIAEDNEEQYTRQGQLTIITMHKAKGLDWDYVFIPFLHEDLIPGQPWVPNSAKFLGDFTLADVARGQLRHAVHYNHIYNQPCQDLPDPLTAWQEAAKLKKAEEYRLLYVAMTRAKRLLWISAEKKAPFRWNTFLERSKNNLQAKQPCPVIQPLFDFVRQKV